MQGAQTIRRGWPLCCQAYVFVLRIGLCAVSRRWRTPAVGLALGWFVFRYLFSLWLRARNIHAHVGTLPAFGGQRAYTPPCCDRLPSGVGGRFAVRPTCLFCASAFARCPAVGAPPRSALLWAGLCSGTFSVCGCVINRLQSCATFCTVHPERSENIIGVYSRARCALPVSSYIDAVGGIFSAVRLPRAEKRRCISMPDGHGCRKIH